MAPTFLMLLSRIGLSFCVLVTCLATSAPAASASAPVALDWSAPSGCPSSNEVLEEVTRLLGPRPETKDPALRVSAVVRQKDEGPFVVRLEIPSPAGPRFREVSAVSCAALGQATALILALMIDPEAALAEPVPAPPPEDPPKPVPIAPNNPFINPYLPAPIIPVPLGRLPPAAAPPAPPISPAIRRPRIAIAAHFATDFGSLPRAAYGPGGNLGILLPNLRFDLGGSYFTEQQNALGALPAAGSKVNFFAVHAGLGLPVEMYERLEFTPRFRIELARFSASSYGVSQPGDGSATSVGVNVGGGAYIKIIDKFRIFAGGDLVLFFVHPQFLVTGIGVVHESSAFVGRLSFGGEVRF